MGLIEVQAGRNEFESLLHFLISSGAPVPVATLEVLGTDRLIDRFEWVSLEVSAPPADIAPPARAVIVRANVRITHVSIAELEDDAAARTVTDATAWFSVGVSAAPHRLTVDLVRVDVAGRPTTPIIDYGFLASWRRFATSPPFPLPPGVVAVDRAVLAVGELCVLRIATGHDSALGPIIDRKPAESTWAIYLSPGVFVEPVFTQIEKGISKLPPDVVVEDEFAPGWGLTPWTFNWGVLGDFGVRRRMPAKACWARSTCRSTSA